MSNQSLHFSSETETSMNAVLISASASRYEGDWSSIPHSHTFTELFYVREGKGSFLIESQIFPIEKDDLIIVNPHLSHTEISNGISPLSYFTVGVDGISFSFNDHRDFQIFFILMRFFRSWTKRQKDMKASACIFWKSLPCS